MVLMFWTTGGERYVKEYESGGSYCRAVFVSHLYHFVKAMEVYLHNPWLTYSLGLHRLREAGLAPDIFSVLNGRALTLAEITSTERATVPRRGWEWYHTSPTPTYQSSPASTSKLAYKLDSIHNGNEELD